VEIKVDPQEIADRVKDKMVDRLLEGVSDEILSEETVSYVAEKVADSVIPILAVVVRDAVADLFVKGICAEELSHVYGEASRLEIMAKGREALLIRAGVLKAPDVVLDCGFVDEPEEVSSPLGESAAVALEMLF